MPEARLTARRSLLAVAAAAAVLLLALGAHWLLTRPVTGPIADTELRAPSRAANGVAIADDASPTNATPAGIGDNDARQAADTAGATPPIALRIVDAERKPVAGASVRVDPNAAEIEFLDLQDAEPLLAAVAPRTSDEYGLVYAQLPRGVAMATARKGDAYVQAWIDVAAALTDPVELQVLPDRELVVHTQLPDGTTAPHVPVELAYSWDRNVAIKRLQRHVLGRTDENGELVVRHAQRLFRATPVAPKLLLRPLVGGASTAATAVSLNAVRTRVELLCAPHGAIRGTSFARDGQPIVAPIAVELKMQQRDALPLRVEVPAWPETKPGEWFLHPIALGEKWLIDGDAYELLEVVGPRQQGEVVAVLQRHRRTEGRLRFTLLAPDGEALAEAPVQLESAERERTIVRTDRQGGIDVERRPDERSVHIHATERHAHGELRIPATAAAMPASLDAGILQLEAQQLLVQGVVVDASSGAPLQSWLEADTGEPPMQTVASATTAADGTFELWGRATTPLFVRANSSGRRELTSELAPGTRNVVLRMPAERLLYLTMQFDADIDDEEIEAQIEPSGGSWTTYRSDVGIRHQVMPLPDGGDPILVVSAADHALARVPAAAWQQSPRGANVTVDLRGRLATFQVTATRGSEPVEARFLLVAGTAEDRAAAAIDSGTALVLTTDRPWRALVMPANGGTVEVALQRGRNVVEVPGPARIRCSLASGGGELGDARVTFELLRLRYAEPLLAHTDEEPPPAHPATIDELREDGRNVTRKSRPKDEAPAGHFEIGHQGRYAVFAVLEQGGHAVLLAQPPAEFDVAGFDCDLPIVVPLHAAALAAAREQLARDAGPR